MGGIWLGVSDRRVSKVRAQPGTFPLRLQAQEEQLGVPPIALSINISELMHKVGKDCSYEPEQTALIALVYELIV